MVKQISLDTWSVHHLQELLVKATNFISQTNTPIVYSPVRGVHSRKNDDLQPHKKGILY